MRLNFNYAEMVLPSNYVIESEEAKQSLRAYTLLNKIKVVKINAIEDDFSEISQGIRNCGTSMKDLKTGDWVRLREFVGPNGSYTGREIFVEVTSVKPLVLGENDPNKDRKMFAFRIIGLN
jgi:hypothetical protein